MRLVVTGAGGGLGRAFLHGLGSHNEVHAFRHADLDIGDHHSVMRTIPPLAPEAIVNCAAFTAVDGCQTDPTRAFRVNAIGPQNLAIAARASGAALLHVSTDYVFDGEKGSPYDELDPVHPLSEYGRSKLAGERFVRHLLAEHFIVRTASVFGAGDDFLSGAITRLSHGETVGALIDRFGTPTYVHHLADRLFPLLLSARFGTYHLAGPQRTCWYEVLLLAKERNALAGTVEPQTAEDLALPAPRPTDSSLTSVLLPHLDVPAMPSLEAALAEMASGEGKP